LCIRLIACLILLAFVMPLIVPLIMVLSELFGVLYAAVEATFPWSVLLLILIGRRLILLFSRYYRTLSYGSDRASFLWFFRRTPSSFPSRTADDLMTDGIEILEVRSDNSAVCRVCGTEILSDGVMCRRCHTPHHHECWQYVGRCSTYACGERRYTRPAPTVLKLPEEPPHSQRGKIGY
jgi:ribosomal protein L40E